MYQNVDLYMEPQKILKEMKEGYCEMQPSELGFLCGLLRSYSPSKIVEVGVAGGGTTSVVMNCLNMLGSDAKVFSVDLNSECYRRAGKMTGYQLEEIRDKLSNYANHRFVLGHILPEVIEEIYNGEAIDFVILDTVHNLPGELLDFLCILPYLKDDAIVVLHDVTLNLSSSPVSFATKIVLDAVVGTKYFNVNNCATYNIGGVKIGKETRQNIANVFSAFSITWNYYPAPQELEMYTKIYEKYYDEECLILFNIYVKAQLQYHINCIQKPNWYFVEVDKLSCIYVRKKIEENMELLYQHFMNKDDEVIYIVEPDRQITGIVSIGDMCRYYENMDKELKINMQFSSISNVDYLEAEKILNKITSIHEVPVVDRGRLVGLLKSGFEKNVFEWGMLRERLKWGKCQKEKGEN